MKSIENRNKAFASIVEQLPLKRKQVYDVFFKLNKASLCQVLNYLNKDIKEEKFKIKPNDISGRITELKETCFIKEIEDRQKSTRSNNTVTVYEPILNNDERYNLLLRIGCDYSAKSLNLILDITRQEISNYTKEILKIQINKLQIKFKRVQKEIKKINDINKKSSDIK